MLNFAVPAFCYFHRIVFIFLKYRLLERFIRRFVLLKFIIDAVLVQKILLGLLQSGEEIGHIVKYNLSTLCCLLYSAKETMIIRKYIDVFV